MAMYIGSISPMCPALPVYNDFADSGGSVQAWAMKSESSVLSCPALPRYSIGG